MKIRMKATAAGPDGVMLPEHIYDVNAVVGKALVDGGYAESLEQPPVKKKAASPPTGDSDPSGQTGSADNSGEGQKPQ